MRFIGLFFCLTKVSLSSTIKTVMRLFIGLIVLCSYSDKLAYTIFSSTGKKTDFAELVKEASKADVVVFGEIHNVSIAHWLELQLVKKLYTIKGNNLMLGAEMLEADDQLAVNEYLHKSFEYSTFKNEVKLWNNFGTDYKPLLDFARENSLLFIATNAPRRYSGIVYNYGIDSLGTIAPEAKNWLAPLPIYIDTTLTSYKEMAETSGHIGTNLVAAQALKDATMAYFINKNYIKDGLFIHFNGSYHNEAIINYFKKFNPGLKILSISCVEQEQLESLEKENKEIADYIIAIPTDMAKSY